MERNLLFAVAAALASVAAPSTAGEPPAAPPSLYVLALPAAVSLVAWLPGEAKGDLVLDLRTEVVLPNRCGDRVAGLLKRGGPLATDDVYEVVLERKEVGECKKEPTRVGARWAIRMRVADGETRELQVGGRALKVARAGDQVTLDGAPPTGDAPGAPATAKPATFVVGEATAAKYAGGQALDGQQSYTAVLTVETSAKLPRCAGAPIGFLARGDAASRFALTHFEPLALAPLDGSCTAATRTRKAPLKLVWRAPGEHRFTVGKIEIAGTSPPAAKAEAKK